MTEAEATVLWAASSEEVRSSATVLDRAAVRRPDIRDVELRVAYWELVSRGHLIRSPKGVKRA